jgi:triacylglycerol lipase
LSNPAIQFIDDPIVTTELLQEGQPWAGDLDLTDPLVSPRYGSLAGLPSTAVYSGSLDLLAPDVLVLQDKTLATPGADLTFTLRKGLVHDWAMYPWLPETAPRSRRGRPSGRRGDSQCRSGERQRPQ